MLTFGFELEAFCLSLLDDQPVLAPDGVPKDECGWLAEIRSQPDSAVYRAIALLKAEKEQVEASARKKGVKLLYEPLFEIPRALKVKAARTHGKGLINYRNVYGYETHRNSTRLQTASLHVSVKDTEVFRYTNSRGDVLARDIARFVDYAHLIAALDREFKEEIRKAKRNPGFYEVKPDGRIEYRSLPNTVDLDKLRVVLENLKLY